MTDKLHRVSSVWEHQILLPMLCLISAVCRLQYEHARDAAAISASIVAKIITKFILTCEIVSCRNTVKRIAAYELCAFLLKTALSGL